MKGTTADDGKSFIGTAIPHLGNTRTSHSPSSCPNGREQLSFFTSKRKYPLSSAVPQGKRESSLAVALPLLVTPTQPSPLRPPGAFRAPNFPAGGFLCVQGMVSSRGLSVSHLNPAVDSVQHPPGSTQQGREAEPQGWHRNPPPG